MYYPDWKEFQILAEYNEIIPIYTEISGDIETPVSLYKKVCSDTRYSFLLESAEKPGSIGRYSFIGFNPRAIFRSKGFKVELIEGNKVKRLRGNPLNILNKYLKKYKGTRQEGLPRFISGAVGYFSYDLVRHFIKLEEIPDELRVKSGYCSTHTVIVDSLVNCSSLNVTLAVTTMS